MPDALFQSTRPARGATPTARAAATGSTVSIHAPRAGRDPCGSHEVGDVISFNPRPPRAARLGSSVRIGVKDGFNPRAPRGARHGERRRGGAVGRFQSTRPARGATRFRCTCWPFVRCLNPRAPRGARRGLDVVADVPLGVSIHAPRAGRDRPRPSRPSPPGCFNPRAPRGARRAFDGPSERIKQFQSTRPARGATAQCLLPWKMSTMFQSTRPARGATLPVRREAHTRKVSIHAPRAGRDHSSLPASVDSGCFNPRAPRGARPPKAHLGEIYVLFQSTRPARGATFLSILSEQSKPVSIHAPRAGRDDGCTSARSGIRCFNPRAPRGARPQRVRRNVFRGKVSIHAPRAGRDLQKAAVKVLTHLFQSTRPARGATVRLAANADVDAFQSTRPARGATRRSRRSLCGIRVSIHAPRAGRDLLLVGLGCGGPCFNPRAPRGARRRIVACDVNYEDVSIHAPRAGRDIVASW